jgi:predicted Zn-dependent protease
MQKKGAELAMELNDNDVAYACLRRACFLDPDDHVLATDLAQTMANLGRVPQAVKSLRSHLKKFPDDIELYIELGLIAERDESCREAAVEVRAMWLVSNSPGS